MKIHCSVVIVVLACFFDVIYAERVSYTGYIVDNSCWNLPNHHTKGNINLEVDPHLHTVKCLLAAECKKSGYNILQYHANTGKYSVKYMFDETTNYNVVGLLETKQLTDTNINITVIGDIDSSSSFSKHLKKGTIIDPVSGNVFSNCLAKSTEATSSPSYDSRIFLIYLHTGIMVYAWLFAAPLSIFIVKYYRHQKRWLYLHTFFSQSTLLGVSSIFFTIVTSPRTFFEMLLNPHSSRKF
jgi:hypothetical protein